MHRKVTNSPTAIRFLRDDLVACTPQHVAYACTLQVTVLGSNGKFNVMTAHFDPATALCMPSFMFSVCPGLHYTIIVAVFDQHSHPQEWNIDMLAPPGEEVVGRTPFSEVYETVPASGNKPGGVRLYRKNVEQDSDSKTT